MEVSKIFTGSPSMPLEAAVCKRMVIVFFLQRVGPEEPDF
jgi:hypothetical protein